MDMLHVQDGQIVTAAGKPVRLRGFNIGGWLNMEDFIDGYTGAEHNLRATMARILGPQKAGFFFERLLDYFFTEDDVAYMRSLGANLLRLPFNYRHFEADARPFTYLEEGFRRLDRAVEWCARHGIYVILDLHAVPGWHNPDWHSDNAHVHILLYSQPHFQERAAALWQEIARRYAGNPAVAGYDLMNEPVTRLEYEQYRPSYYDWPALNGVFRKLAAAIRAVDREHILFLEGDEFATQFDGLDVSFDANLAVSTHNYTAPTTSRGAYPGVFGGKTWNRDALAAEFTAHSGTRLASRMRLPIFAGEFGVWYRPAPQEIEQRVRALDDQLSVFESAGAHRTIWTLKDIGAMGTLNLAPGCDYLRLIDPVLQAKHLLDDWDSPAPATPAAAQMKALADGIDSALAGLGLDARIERNRFGQFSLFGYLAQFLQVPYARLFKDLTEAQIDALLQAFAFKNCVPNRPLEEVLKKHFQA